MMLKINMPSLTTVILINLFSMSLRLSSSSTCGRSVSGPTFPRGTTSLYPQPSRKMPKDNSFSGEEEVIPILHQGEEEQLLLR